MKKIGKKSVNKKPNINKKKKATFNKATLFQILKIICYCLSFPLFLVCAIIVSSKVIGAGQSYGGYVWAGIIVASLLSIIWAVIVLCYELQIKKAPNKKAKIRKDTRNLAIASFCILAGLMLIFDIAMPALLPDATSKTIFYEDLADDYMGRANVNKKLLDDFIAINVKNGNLGSVNLNLNDKEAVDKEIKKYQKLGMNSKAVYNLLARDGENCLFISFNLNGYESFVGPWIDMANDNRMTVPAIVYLIVGQRPTIASDNGSPKKNDDGTKVFQDEDQDFYYRDTVEGFLTKKVHWTVLDMMGEPINIDLAEVLNGKDLSTFLNDLIVEKVGEDKDIPLGEFGMIKIRIKDGIVKISINVQYESIKLEYEDLTIPELFTEKLPFIGNIDGIVDGLLESVSLALGDDAIAGAPIHIKFVDSEGETYMAHEYFNHYGSAVALTPNNEMRGVLGYQNQAWLDSNGLVFMLCSLMSIREVCYIFSGVCVVMMLLAGYFREKEYDEKLAQQA